MSIKNLNPIPYYNVEDIMVIMDCGKSKAYKLCKEINEHYHSRIGFQGRVFKDHFDKYMMN